MAATAQRQQQQGLDTYYKQKIEALEVQIRDKQLNLRRQEAQCVMILRWTVAISVVGGRWTVDGGRWTVDGRVLHVFPLVSRSLALSLSRSLALSLSRSLARSPTTTTYVTFRI